MAIVLLLSMAPPGDVHSSYAFPYYSQVDGSRRADPTFRLQRRLGPAGGRSGHALGAVGHGIALQGCGPGSPRGKYGRASNAVALITSGCGCQASYSRDAVLPDDAEREALVRGVQVPTHLPAAACSEVIRAVVLEGSPCLLRGLRWCGEPPPQPRANTAGWCSVPTHTHTPRPSALGRQLPHGCLSSQGATKEMTCRWIQTGSIISLVPPPHPPVLSERPVDADVQPRDRAR